MKIDLCDQIDCPLHQEYSKSSTFHSQPEYQSKHYSPPANMGEVHTANDVPMNANAFDSVCVEKMFDQLNTDGFKVGNKKSFSKLHIKLGKEIEIPIECFLCSHRKGVDMKEIIVAVKAKEMLEE
jgi:hypothetical protein